jgi:hypothetical protein
VGVVAVDTAFLGRHVARFAGEDFLEILMAIEADLVDGRLERSGLLAVFALMAEAAIAVLEGAVRGDGLLASGQGSEVVFPELRHRRTRGLLFRLRPGGRESEARPSGQREGRGAPAEAVKGAGAKLCSLHS